MNRADVVLVDWPFSDRTGSKLRPAVVVQADFLNGLIDDTVLVQITSKGHGIPGTEVKLDPAIETTSGLLHISFAFSALRFSLASLGLHFTCLIVERPSLWGPAAGALKCGPRNMSIIGHNNLRCGGRQCVAGVKLDQAGHVIANVLGGSGKLKDGNIFPINSTINQGQQNKLETRVKALVKPGTDVCLAVLLDYSKSDPDFPGRPSSVVLNVYVNGSKVDTLAYDNAFPPNPFDPVPGRPNRCSDQYAQSKRQRKTP